MITFAQWITDAPSWLQNLPEWIQNFVYQLYQTFVYQDRWMFFVEGLKITFIVAIGALCIGVVIGLIVAIIRVTHDTVHQPMWFIKLLNAICKVYLAVIRGTPMMVQLLIMGFVIMVPKTEGAMIFCGILTLGINSGAYVAEIARSGLNSIDRGQMEAGRSLGMSYLQTMWKIVIPQAIKNILPSLGNEMITLLKDTSLVSVIALRDVTKQAQNIVAKTYQAYVPYISLACIYLIIVLVLTKLLSLLERRLRKNER